MPEKQTVRQPGGERLDNQPADFDPVADARRLLRTVRSGALATIDAGSGYPFATLVNVATDLDGSPVMLLSSLSAHRRNIEADPRVSLLLSQGGKGDPLAHPRLTLIGRAAVSAEERLRRRFLARHPKSALYADFGDFDFFQVTIEGGHLNGGFARAAKLSPEELCTELSDAQDLMAAEEGAVAQINEGRADTIRLYATRLLAQQDGAWRITGLDPDGADLALGDDTARLAFPARVRSSSELRQMLARLAGEARALPG
jgi:putative heme iron utilization protein